MKTNINANVYVHVGGLAAVAYNSTIVNVESNVSFDCRQTGTNNVFCKIGGLVGYVERGGSIIKCLYRGNLHFKGASTAITANDNAHIIGGILGELNSNITIDQCSVNGNVTEESGGPNVGGIVGHVYDTNSFVIKITNITLNVNVKYTGACNSPDIGLICGWFHSQNLNATNGSVISNIYVVGGATYCNSTTPTYYFTTTASNFSDFSKISNISLPVASGTTVYPVWFNESSSAQRKGSTAAVVTEANKNSAITNNFSVSSSGTVTSKLSGTGNISYVIGRGASWGGSGSAPKTYTVKSTAQTITAGVATVPTRTGYTFKGWSLTGPTGGTPTTGKYVIPANQKGNINVYAVWETKDFSGTAPAGVTVVYGSDATLSAAALTHAAGTTSTEYGVTITYQWKTSTGSNISGATGSTYKITKPGYTAGTNYQVTVTATPKDGITPARTHTYTVSLKVNRQGVAVPVAKTGLIYNGSVQTGVSTTNTLITLGGATTGTAAGSYNATAALPNGNYCWGSNGGTDTAQKTITWTIAKASVAVPSVTGTSFVYNAAAQSPTPSAIETALVTLTNTAQTDVGSYTTTFALKDTRNYKWAVAQSGKGESDAYVFNWAITKADITLTAPTYDATLVGGGSDGKTYIGMTVADLVINQSSGSHVRKDSTSNVVGTWSWVPATTTKITESTTFKAKFTPTDTKNYNAAEIDVTVTATQLYVNVKEILIKFYNGATEIDLGSLNMALASDRVIARSITNTETALASATVKFPVDYNGSFNLALLSSTQDGDKVNGVTIDWQRPTGYTMSFYSSSNGTGKITSTTLTGITADRNVYIGYDANDVDYTIVTVLQDLKTQADGSHTEQTPWVSRIIELLDDPDDSSLQTAIDAGLLRVQKFKAAAGSRVSHAAENIEGFKRVSALTVEGDNDASHVYKTDNTSKLVLGSGHTVLITYYQRNSYTVHWEYRGGVTTHPSDPDKTINDSLDMSYQYGEAFVNVADPTFPSSGYNFGGWYADYQLSTVAQIPATMPAENVNLYARLVAQVYDLKYDYNLSTLLVSLGFTGAATVLNPYSATLNPSMANVADNGPSSFTIDQVISSGVLRLGTPAMDGFKFVGWAYYDEENDAQHRNPIIIKGISAADATSEIIAKNHGCTLYAMWESERMAVTIDLNGGNRLSGTSAVRNGTLQVIDERFADPTSGKYLRPTRSGYEFVGWTLDDGTPLNAGMRWDWKANGSIIRAQWKAVPITIEMTESAYNSGHWESATFVANGDGADGEEHDFEYSLEEGLIFRGNTLVINIVPYDGYEVDRITVGGSTYINGSTMTVGTYRDNKIIVDVRFVARVYTVTYNWDGGSYVGSTAYQRTFTVADVEDDTYNPFKLIGGDLVKRTGYIFDGWTTASGDSVGQADQQISEIDAFYQFNGRNVTLTANWRAAPVTMIYNNNFTSTGSDGMGVEEYEENRPTVIYTGATFDLWQPDSQPFVPANRELIGWSTEPNGEIAYAVSYRFVANGEQSKFEPQPVSYTVRATEDNTNTLYAIWRVTNVQYVAYEALNNNTTFSTDPSYTGVTLNAYPRYAYQKEDGLTLQFKWYKVDPSWGVWTQADIDAITNEDQRNQASANLGLHKIPSNATPVRTSEVLTNVAAADQVDTLNIRNVADAGLYICALTAKGSYFSADGGLKSSTVTMYGEFNIVINKQDLKGITFKSPEQPSAYTSEAQSIFVEMPTEWTFDAVKGAVRLPDGSYLKVVYNYFDAADDSENPVATPDAVVNVGDYSVVATFSFIDDKGNYNLPEDMSASYSITPRQINSVTYKLQTNINGTWTDVSTFVNNVYSRNQFRVVASSADVMTADRQNVEFVIYYDGDQLTDHRNGPTNVGDYSAYAAELAGTAAGNYVLSSNVATQNFNIIRATHDLGITLNNSTVKYNGDKDTAGTIQTLPDIVITEGGKPVTVIKDTDAANIDYIQLADGSMLMLTYTVTRNDVSSFNEDLTGQRGAIHAGNYTVTVQFTEVNAGDEINFNPVDDKTATLVIEKIPYSGANGVAGLSDEELNRYVDNDGSTPNLNGFGDNHSVAFNPDASVVYKPVLNLDSTKFRVTYTYEVYDESVRAFKAMDKEAADKGLSAAGLYRVSAAIVYIDPQYVNDYEELGGKVVELRITPGVLKEIKAEYNALPSENYTYGDAFNFYYYSSGEYRLKIMAIYVGFESTPAVLENRSVQFLDENGDAFTVFNRASRKEDGSKITETTDDYTIVASVYGMTTPFTVPVKQAHLDSKDINFDDNNIRFVSTGFEYTTNFDGQGHIPGLAGADSNYNFVGVIEGDLKKGDVEPVYKYTTGASGGSKLDMPAEGFIDYGTTYLEVTFNNNNTNYAPIPDTTVLSTKVIIKQRILQADDILWQYSTKSFNDATANDIVTLESNETLPYRGQDGYNVRAVYRNLKQNNQTADDYYLTVGQIGDSSQSTININNAKSYDVAIKALLPSGESTATHESRNYALADSSMKVAVVVSPKVVNINWVLNDNAADKSLTFNGKDQLNGSTANVKATFVKNADGETAATNATISVVTDSSDYAVLKNVGMYMLHADLGDSNYTASNDDFSVAIDKYVVTTDNTSDIAWAYGEDNIAITADNHTVVYFGKDLDANLSFTDLENTKVTVKVGQNGNVVRNAGSYILSAIEVLANYDLSKLSQAFEIEKCPVTVNWTNKDAERVYNGTNYTVLATADPVGDDIGRTIIELSGNDETNANKTETDKYTATAKLSSEFSVNYQLVNGTANVESVSIDWRIEKKTVRLIWDIARLVYAEGNSLTDWSVRADGTDVVEGDTPVVTTVIYDKDNVNPIANNAFTVAGTYTVRITAVSDDNYVVAADDLTKTVTVAKARPVIDSVVYNEYDAINSTYQGNNGLRDDKLTYNSNGVAGKLTFTGGGENVDLSKAQNGRYIPCTFTPDDLANYEVVSYNDLVIDVLQDRITHVANVKDSLTYSVNQTITAMAFKIYFVYASYYVDGTNSQEYGRRDVINMNEYTKYGVVFMLNRTIENAPRVQLTNTQGHTFEMADLNDSTSNTLLVDIITNDYTGSVEIILVSALPEALHIANEEELLARRYFVGSTFDKNWVQFTADYKDTESGSVSSDLITCDTVQLLNVGEQVIKFTYVVGSQIVTASIKIIVEDKIVVTPKFEDSTYRWTEDGLDVHEIIKEVVRTNKGEDLPEGISIAVTMQDGTPVALVLADGEDSREFKLLIKFTVDETMYYPIEDLQGTITLVRIAADIDNATLKGPWGDGEPLSKTDLFYTGSALDEAAYGLRAPSTISDALGTYEVSAATYKIRYSEGGLLSESVTEIRIVGIYEIVATFKITSADGKVTFSITRSYTIELKKAANEITEFTIGNWIEGEEAKSPLATSKFGEIIFAYEGINGTDYYRSSVAPTKAGNYRVIAYVDGTTNYDGVDEMFVEFTVTQPQISAKDDEGNEIATITGSDGKGVTPGYSLKVDVIADTSALGTNLRKQIVMGGYDISIVDATGNVVENPGEYTVKLLLTAEQLAAKNLKIYTVDEYGTATEITNGKIEGDYMVFTTSDFNGEFILSARDVAADQQMAWIIGLSVGGLVVVIAIVALIVVVVKKKKEND